jgi:hypothetical protein
MDNSHRRGKQKAFTLVKFAAEKLANSYRELNKKVEYSGLTP